MAQKEFTMTTQEFTTSKLASSKAYIFDKREIAHLWIHAEKREARTRTNNFSFHGDTLISYATPIAQIFRKRGKVVATLHLNQTWSVTTSGQQCLARQSCNQFPIFHVASFDDIKRNLADYKGRIAVQAITAQRAKSRKQSELWRLEALTSEANNYAKLVGSKAKFKAMSAADLLQLEIAAREESKKQAERNKLALLEKEKRAAERLQRAMSNLGGWLRGELPSGEVSILPFSYLRVRQVIGEEAVVQTTQGATVPLQHVQRAIPLVLKLIERGETWQRNGHSIHLGHYQLDRITADGQVIAGCHKFEASEVKRFAKVLESLPVELETTPDAIATEQAHMTD